MNHASILAANATDQQLRYIFIIRTTLILVMKIEINNIRKH